MDFIIYFVGGRETQEEVDIMDKWGELEIDPSFDSQMWKVSLLSIEDLFKLCNELGLITFQTYLPHVNGDAPLIELIVARQEELC